MNRYFFILGRNHILSSAEIISVLSLQKIRFFVNNISREAVILETETVLENINLMGILGGTVKLGIIKNKIGLDEEETKFEEIFSARNLLTHFLPKKEGKLHFGISIYNAGGEDRHAETLKDKLKDLNLAIKNNLKEEGVRTGFVKIKERFLSSVSVEKNGLLTKGAEIVLLVTDRMIYVGKTLAVQEFEKFSFRDIKRPRKDKRSGIMPPKLARMMINLALIDKGEILLDPFCGSGTVLQEAVEMGYKNVVGADINPRAISDTQENLDWLFRSLKKFSNSSYNIKILNCDAALISQKISANSVDAIVTEPYLGPPLYKKPDFDYIKKIIFELEDLYIKAFSQFVKILKKDGRIVIIFPVFEKPYNHLGGSHDFPEVKRTEQRYIFLNILDKIRKIGFVQKDFFHKELIERFPLPLTPRGSIIYGSSGQFVKREIISFKRTPLQ